jgi:nitrate/nitrite transporter NarK
VLHFLVIYLLIQITVYGAVFYLPTEISTLIGKPTGLKVGAVSAIPWIAALGAVYWLPRFADQQRSHRHLAAWTLLVCAGASFAFPNATPLAGLVALSFAVATCIAVQPVFWTFPTGYLADTAAAGGIAIIAMGNLGGFIAPPLKVWADEHFHSPSAGLYLLAALTLLNAGLISLVKAKGRTADAGTLH